MPESTSSTFFSYSRKDSEFALRLARDLRSSGVPVWLDQLDIEAGDRWDTAVETALRQCQRVLVVLSPTSTTSQNVMDEVSYALDERKILIPVLYQACNIPFRLRRIQHADFQDNYRKGLAYLEEVFDCKITDDTATQSLPPPHPLTAIAHPPALTLPLSLPQPNGEAAAPAAAPWWKHALLLGPAKADGRPISRGFYYVLLVFTVFYVIGIFIDDAGGFDWGKPWREPGPTVGGFLVLLTPLAVCWYRAHRSGDSFVAQKRL